MASSNENENTDLTRREFCQGALLLAGSAGIGGLWSGALAEASAESATNLGLVQFGLGDVQLTPGSRLANAALTNAHYLLSLSNDRLLYSYRACAGIDNHGVVPYGGWEGPTVGFRGQFAGHYLSACAKASVTVKSSNHHVAAQCKSKADDLVAGLAACQLALNAKTGADSPGHAGYLNAQDHTVFDRLESLEPCAVPYYVIHKIMAGLVDAFQYTDNHQALSVATGMADYFNWRFSRLGDSKIAEIINTRRYQGQSPVYFMEFGGMADILINLFRITGDPSHLNLAGKFDRSWFRQMLAEDRDELGQNAEHCNTEIPCVIGLANRYDLTADLVDRTASLNFLDWMQYGHEFADGTVSGISAYPPPLDYGGELFMNRYLLNRQINGTAGHPGHVMGESCGSHNLNKLTARAFAWTGSARWGDQYEKRFVNAVLSQQHPETGMLIYNLNLKQGSTKDFGTPEDTFWCCYGTGVEAYAHLSDGAYWRDKANGLWINAFLPSTLTWKEQGLTLTQATSFPDDGHSTLTIVLDRPRQLTMHIRIPVWATGRVSVKVNRKELTADKTPGSFLSISRLWTSGDVVDINLPYSLHSQIIPDRPEYVAVMYGPHMLSACTGTGATYCGTMAQLLAALKPSGQPCEFTVHLSTGPAIFKPLNQMTSEIYNGYTIVTEPPQEQVLDEVVIADDGSEMAHRLESSGSNTGTFRELHWRAATGGFVSYHLQVDPSRQTYLKCVYWGNDCGHDDYWRIFDILVESPGADSSRVIATQSLNHEVPDTFFDVLYPIPIELTLGKSAVKVVFRAKGFFGKQGVMGGLFNTVQTHCYDLD